MQVSYDAKPGRCLVDMSYLNEVVMDDTPKESAAELAELRRSEKKAEAEREKNRRLSGLFRKISGGSFSNGASQLQQRAGRFTHGPVLEEEDDDDRSGLDMS